MSLGNFENASRTLVMHRRYSRFAVKWPATYIENAHFGGLSGHLTERPLNREFYIPKNGRRKLRNFSTAPAAPAI